MKVLDPAGETYRTDTHVDVEQVLDRAIAVLDLLLSNAEEKPEDESVIPAFKLVYNLLDAVCGHLHHAKRIIHKKEDETDSVYHTIYRLKTINGPIGERAKEILLCLDTARDSKNEVALLAEKAGLAIKTA